MDVLMQTGIKVFGVGLNKTGLTSLLTLFKRAGVRSEGRNRKMHVLFNAGRYADILEHYDNLGFTCDYPVPLMYKLAYYRFQENAKFILTVRGNSKEWYESLLRHNALAHPFKNKHHWTHKRYYPHGFAEEHMAYYDRHVSEVRRFFKENNAEDRLLVLSIAEAEAVKRIEDFLGISFGTDVMPHENRSDNKESSFSNGLKRNINRIVQPIYAFVAPKVTRKQVRPVYEAEASSLAKNK